MTSLDLRDKVNIGLAVVVAIFLTITVRSLLGIRQLVRTGDDVAQTLEVRATVRSTVALLSTIEAAERGFLLTQDSEFLAPVRRTRDAVAGNLSQLRRLTGGRSRQHQRFERIAPLIRARLAIVDTLAHTRPVNVARGVAGLPRDVAVMDSLRTWLAAMDSDELSALGSRQEQTQDNARGVVSLVITGSLLAVLVALVFGHLFHRDLTQRLQAEALYRSVVDVMAEGVVVQHASGAVVDCNKASERILGLGRDELLAPGGRDWAGRHEDGTPYPLADHPATIALRTGEPVRNQVMGIQRPDGAVRWLLINAMPLLAGRARQPVGAVTSFSDITRRREAEAAMRDSEGRMRDFLDNATDMIVTTDSNGRILYANRAWQDALGYSAVHQYTGRPMTDFLDASSDAIARHTLRDIREGRCVRDMSITFVAADGHKVLVSGSCAPRLEHGRVVATQSIFRDVTELSAAQEQLMLAIEHAERANAAKSEFLANMSHELRTPLNSVIGFAGVLLRNPDGHLHTQDVQYLSRIHDNGRHLLGLINNILDLSKVESGRVELELAPTDLGTLIRETLAQMEPQVQGRPIALRTIVPADAQPLVTDAGKLKQILINLVANALKFTEQGSVTVRVTADSTGRPVAIAVSDTGLGIALERQAAVFEAFQQADNTTARRYGGTGLGLTITRSLAQLLGYHITLASQPGAGSTFTLRLGTEHATSDADAAPLDSELAAAIQGGRTVLVVDDDADARLLLAQFVRDDGCHALQAASGEQGLRMAREARPDLILLDLMMPRMNGLEFLQALRSDPELSGIPVVIVSIVATEHRHQAVGAVALIDKPVERQELEAVLTRFLAEPPEDKREQLDAFIAGTAAIA